MNAHVVNPTGTIVNTTPINLDPVPNVGDLISTGVGNEIWNVGTRVFTQVGGVARVYLFANSLYPDWSALGL